MAVFYLRHTPVGKTTHRPRTVWANARYIMRRSAVESRHTQHMPDDFREIQAFLYAREDTSRKNARVADKLILNLPRELTPDQNVNLVRNFLSRITEGRAPYLFTIHNNIPDHPHAHVILIDADVETGKRVFKTTDAGSTYRLRALWETTCNEYLKDHGHDVTISRWGKKRQPEKALPATRTPEPAPKEARKRRIRLAPIRPRLHLEPARRYIHAPLLGNHGAPSMPDVVQQSGVSSTTQKTVSFILAQQDELDRLVAARETLQRKRGEWLAAEKRLETLKATMEETAKKLAYLERTSAFADNNLKLHRTKLGRLKGFKVGRWKSASRKRAEAARMQSHIAAFNLADTKASADALVKEAYRLQRQKVALQEEAETLKQLMSINGTEAEMDNAEQALRLSIDSYLGVIHHEDMARAFSAGLITPTQYMRMCKLMAVDVEAGIEH